MMINRRKLITGLISFVAAPAIVRASNLMSVKVMDFNYSINAIDILYGILEVDPKWFAMLIAAENDVLKVTGITDEMFYLK